MDPLALLAALCILGAIVLGLIGIYRSSASPRNNMERRLGRMIGEGVGSEIETASAIEGLRHRRSGSIPVIGMFLAGRSWSEEMAAELERADIKLTVSEFVALRIMMAGVLALLPFLLLGGLKGIILAVVLGVVGVTLPRLWVSRSKARRINKLNAQLPDTLTMLSNSLKAGFGLMQSMELVSRELEHPIATDIRRTLQDINVGQTTEDALLNLAARSGSTDLDIVVTAMLIQQSTGGNLAEILDTVGHTMRERIRIRGEIKTLTTQGTLTGIIIGGLPIFIALAVSVMNPSYIEPLFTTLTGQAMLFIAAIMEFFGIMIIKKILAIEV